MSTSPAWVVTTQSETMGIGPNGLAGPGVRVGFQLADGTAASVFVPDSQYTPDNVKALIAARAATVTAIKGLAP